jgi:3'(2'), 5'-bisphosphate nucleotidase
MSLARSFNLEKELEVARRVAREAGKQIMHFYTGDYEVEWKGANDPVTIADRQASELIINQLRRQFPEDGLISEEAPDSHSRLDKQRVWIVDPIDGTKQFIEHIGEFAVMIGMIIDGAPRVGVVYQPSADRMYFAAEGTGAFLEEPLTTRRLHVSRVTDPSQMVMAVSRSHPSEVVARLQQALGIGSAIASGSVGLKFGMLAEGRAHIYVHLGSRTNQWDTCAPEVILREAGGKVTDTGGERLLYNTSEIRNLRGIVATNGMIDDKILTTLAAMKKT